MQRPHREESRFDHLNGILRTGNARVSVRLIILSLRRLPCCSSNSCFTSSGRQFDDALRNLANATQANPNGLLQPFTSGRPHARSSDSTLRIGFRKSKLAAIRHFVCIRSDHRPSGEHTGDSQEHFTPPHILWKDLRKAELVLDLERWEGLST